MPVSHGPFLSKRDADLNRARPFVASITIMPISKSPSRAGCTIDRVNVEIWVGGGRSGAISLV
jgi:hypothetical protein